MKAMILNDYGNDAEFQMADLPKPTARDGHVVVRIAATSVNTVDTMIRQLGQENLPLAPGLPAVLGMDFSGVVDTVGAGVTNFASGDEVYGCAGGLVNLQGALAEYIAADAQLIAHKPKSLSMREAAALPLVGITAYEGLQRANVQSGQKVLVHGGAGGVGHIAVQLARYFETNVFATCSGEDQARVIEGFGATPINYRTQKVADYVAKYTDGTGFEVVFDSVGGANMTNSFEAAALNANIATTVSLVEIDLTPAHFKGLSLHVVFMLIPMLHDFKREAHGAILAKLSEIADAGTLKPLIDEQHFDLSNVGQAYARLSSGQAMGKVIIDV